MAPTPVPEEPPRLLRGTKTTAAALGSLAKGIKFLHRRDFAKARAEFESILDDYPDEPEISARVRSYLQICARGDGAQKRVSVADDQLYTLGVMEHNRGNFKSAITCFRQALDQNPDADYIHYSLAASLARNREGAEAIRILRKAIDLNGENSVFAKNDSDFSDLHTDREFIELVGLNPAAAGLPSQS